MNMEIGRIENRRQDEIITSSLASFSKLFLDNFTKLSILTILAGYRKSNRITVADNFPRRISLRQIGSFLSYILNHRIAPMKFDLRVRTAKEAPRVGASSAKDQDSRFRSLGAVLSFSGGLDSTAGLLYALDKKMPVLPLWIDFGQRNSQAEYQSVKKVLRQLDIEPLVFRLDLKRDIRRGWRDWDFIIPGRNFLFLSLANSVLRFSRKKKKSIYLCAHKDESGFLKNRDKSAHFFRQASVLFSAASGQKIECRSPFSRYSKSEILSYWRRKWEKKYGISPFITTTCYYSGGCGRCDACLKRAIYLIAAGYDIRGKVKVNPLRDPAGLIKNSWLPRIKNGRMARNNKLDFFIAVEKSWDLVPGYVRDFYRRLSPNTLRAVKRRKQEVSRSAIR